MSRRSWNPSAQRTIIQINSSLGLLQEKALAINYNEVPPFEGSQHHYQITWYNHVPDRANSGGAFTKLDQYMHILNTNSYHCLLFDGSLIRANFEFEDDVLLAQNLLWWPAPYDFSKLLEDGFSPVDILQDLYGNSRWFETIKMRSPLRFDYDSKKNTIDHPHSHMHIQTENTRLYTTQPICFNRFIHFIFRNFYPNCEIAFSNYDFIEYKTPDLLELEYNSSKIVV